MRPAQIIVVLLAAATLFLLSCRDKDPESGKITHAHPVLDSLVLTGAPIAVSVLDTLSDQERELLRQKLHEKERYDCCIEPGCDLCIELFGACECFEKIKEKERICRDCLSGYRNGLGRIKTLNINELKEFSR